MTGTPCCWSGPESDSHSPTHANGGWEGCVSVPGWHSKNETFISWAIGRMKPGPCCPPASPGHCHHAGLCSVPTSTMAALVILFKEQIRKTLHKSYSWPQSPCFWVSTSPTPSQTITYLRFHIICCDCSLLCTLDLNKQSKLTCFLPGIREDYFIHQQKTDDSQVHK